MSCAASLPALIERFFTERLMHQQHASVYTVASYRDTFRLLLRFASKERRKTPSDLQLREIDAVLISAFLDSLETQRSASTLTRNLRLTAIRSFFRFTAFEAPDHSAHIQRVLAIPSKRHDKKLIHFLIRPEIDALLSAPDRTTWLGRRDHALLLLAIQSGLRLSELTSLDRSSVVLGSGAHVRCTGKGRKERCTPLSKQVIAVLQAWLKEPRRHNAETLFPNVHGGRISSDAVQYLLGKYVAKARGDCPSLKQKRISPHVLRHTAAMELLQAGVDCSVIALWLGHESMETTQTYLHAHMALKEAALAKVSPVNGKTPSRYRPGDRLLHFLDAL
ncbi:MAG TPA: site-specific integrase [Lacipirellulaceae bacterium]